MNSRLLQIVHALPPFARNWAASLHGWRLRSWRYSETTNRLVEEALERDSWSAEEWKQHIERKLKETLNTASQRVPYYRNHWEERRRNGDKSRVDVLENWPILTKEILRQQPEAFLSDDYKKSELDHHTTSGTTGTPLSIWRARGSSRKWYALNEARVKRWHDVDLSTRWGHVGGQPVVSRSQRKPPFWVWNAPMKQLYLSCMQIGPETAPFYLEAIKKYRLEYLLGYSSSIALLAHAALNSGTRINLRVVLSDAEPLLSHQRLLIEKAFSCPARETYGLSETVAAASECPAGNLHWWPEAGYVELLDPNNSPASPGTPGRIVATSLLTPEMPLIRYDTRDLAEPQATNEPCPCGRHLPRLKQILGRNDDMIRTKDGRTIVQIDRMFEPEHDIREAQIIQRELDVFTIRVVPGERWSDDSIEALKSGLVDLVGDANVEVVLVPQIEKTWAGKYRMIVSELPKDGIAAIPR